MRTSSFRIVGARGQCIESEIDASYECDLGDLRALIAGSAFDLLNDKLHVDASDFSPKEVLQIEAELARARAIEEAARGRKRALVAEAMETLRDRGEFIDYRPGEEYDVLPGIITAAENTPTGAHVLLLPHEFPDVHELAACRCEEPKLALRPIMGIIEARQVPVDEPTDVSA